MVTNNYVLNLNINQSDIQETDIRIVQNDYNVNVFEIHIFDEDNEINYADVDSGIIIFKQAYKDIVKQGNLVKSADKFTYTLESINFDGDCVCGVQLYGANEERITATYFKLLIVRDLITEKSIKADSNYDALIQLKNDLETIDVVDLRDEVTAHMAESVSQTVVTGNTRDLTITGNQVISGFDKKPKSLDIFALIPGGKAFSIGKVTSNRNDSIFATTDGIYNTLASAITLGASVGNCTRGNITINNDNTITINWFHAGSGGTGTCEFKIIAHYHGEG